MNMGDADELSLPHEMARLPDSGTIRAGNFSVLFDKLGFAVTVSRASDGVLLDVNEAWVKLFGYTRQEAIGKTTLDLNINPDAELRGRILAQLRESGSAHNLEMRLRTKSGEWCNFLTNVDTVEIDGQDYLLSTVQDITERRRAEEAHWQSEQRFRIVSEVIPFGVWENDREGNATYLSPLFLDMLGQTLEEHRQHWQDLLHPDDILPSLDAWQRCVATGALWEYEYRIRGKDGHYRTIVARGHPVRDHSGTITGYVGINFDVTDRKRAEQQLERSNQKLNEILASIQDDFYVLNRDWNFVYANRLFASKIGKEPEDFIGNNIWEMLPKHIAQSLEENFRAAMEKREIRRFEIPGQYTNAWYSMTAFPSVEGITVVGTDITERKRAEEQLQYQATLLSNVNDAILASDSQFRLTGWNSAAEALYGWKAEEVIGRNGLEVVRTEWQERDAAEMRQRIAETGRWRGEATQTRKDGSRFPVEISSIVLRDETGQITGYVSVNRDITERKKAEEALRMAHRVAVQSEQRLQRVLETDAVGVLFFDSDGYVIQANDVFLKMTGYRREQIQSRELTWRKMTPPEWMQESEAQMETFAQTGRIGPYEKEYLLADGSRRWMLLAGRALGDGTISKYCIDISDRKRTQAAFQQSQKTFQKLIERAPFGIYVVDSQFRIAHMNTSSQTGAFRNVRPVIGRDFAEVMHILWPEEIASGIISVFRHTLETGESYYSPRFTNPRQDVAVVESYEWELQRMTLPDGQYGVICYYYDSTKLREAEKALRESQKQLMLLNESLEQKVQDKTVEVRRLASDLTKVTQRERQRISHVLHDDLQQRIYTIQMQLAFLRDGLPDGNESAAREISDIEKELGHILKITRDLSIDLSPPILRDEGLSHAIEWLAKRMRGQYGLPIELQAEGSFVISNEELHVLLFNCVRELLFNVVKHAEASRAVVALQWSGDDLRIEVRDDGQGFAANSPDQQISGESDVQANLGLPTIRHQLGLFGGRMEIQSEPGAGTRVLLSVPVMKAGESM